MINPTTGLEELPKTNLSGSIKPLTQNIGGTLPATKPSTTDAFNTPQNTVASGGPALNLNKINEYRNALGTGPELQHTATPQAPIDSVSNVSGGLSNLAVKPTTAIEPTTPGVETPPTLPVKTPAQEQASVVTGETPVGTTEIIDQMFPKGQYSDEERKAMTDALSSKNPAEITAFMAKNQADKYAESQKLLQAYRNTRDFGLQQDRAKTLNDQRVADLTQQYDNAITQQKQKMEADANNMGVVLGTAGRLQSRNMQNAVTQMLDTNRNIYSQLVSNKDRDIQRLGEDLKYAQTVASNEYNDIVSKQMQDMLTSIQALDKTGSLATAQGLVQARSFLDSTISNTMQHQADYYSKLSYISQRFDQYSKDALEQGKIDDSVTKTMGDGYLYNAQGMRVKGEDGMPLKVANSSGTLLTKEPITLADGSKAFVYQNPDMTTRVEKIEGTGAPQIDSQTMAKYAQAISTGLIGIDDLQKLGVPLDTINQIIAQTSGKSPEQMSEYQKAQIDIETKKMAQSGQLSPKDLVEINTKREIEGLSQIDSNGNEVGGMEGESVSSNKIGGLQDMTNTLVRPKGSTNVGQDTNNPGNIMAESAKGREYAKSLGATGFYTSPNGRTYAVFPDMNTGLQATKSDIETKLNGGSSWVTPNMTLGELASGWTSGPNAPFNADAAKNYARIAGYPSNTPINQIPKNKLINAIVSNEGVDVMRSAKVPETQSTEQAQTTDIGYKIEQKPLYQKFNNEGILPSGMKITSPAGKKFLQEAKAYGEDTPKEIDPKKQAQFLKIKEHFDGQPQVKEFNSVSSVSKWLDNVGNTDLSGPDIQGLISNYAKILDPTSVVRESEYAMAQSGASQGVIDKTTQQIATFLSGGSNVLSKDAQVILKKAMQRRVDAIAESYRDYAKKEIVRSKEIGIDITYDMLTGEAEKPSSNSETLTGTPVQFKSKSGKTYSF